MTESVDHAPPSGVPELPTLEPGIQLLDIDADRRGERIGPLQSVVVEHLLDRDGTAAWIDTHGHVTTQALGQIVPYERFLERIRLARGFTAFQHFAITETLHADPPSNLELIVAPAIDGQYRDTDIARETAESLFLRTLSRLAALTRQHDLPVLVTRTAATEFTASIEQLADRTITCEYTQLGPRFESEGFETLVYPIEDGLLQTTLTYWQEIIASRVDAHSETSSTQPEVAVDGAY